METVSQSEFTSIGGPNGSLGISSVGYGTYQPKAKFLWVVELNCPLLPGTGGGVGSFERVFSVTAYKAARPKFEFEEITVTHLNEYATFPGKIKKPEAVALEFNDGMTFSASQAVSSSAYDCAQAMYLWKNLIYDASTGTGSYAGDIKGWLVLSMLDPTYNTIEAWTAVGTYPLTIDLGDVSYEDGAAKCSVNATFNVDKWYIGDQRGKALNVAAQ